MDYGISECDFWCMTLAEVIRAVECKKRIQKIEAQDKASYDYILADLIGRSISRLQSSANRMPSIDETYPTIFDTEEIEHKKQDKKDELSAIRFKQFAQAFNNKYREVEKANE